MIQMGAVDTIAKPFQTDEILNRISDQFELYAARRYSELFDLAPVGYFTLGKQAEILYCNSKGVELLGVPREMLIGLRFGKFVEESHLGRFNALFKNALNSQDRKSCELKLVSHDNRTTWARLEAARIFEQDITVLAMIDINEYKLAQDAMAKTNAFLENLLNYANAPIIVWDPGYRILRFNHAFEKLTGMSENQVLRQPLEILFPRDLKQPTMELIRKASLGERWDAVEIQIQHVGGGVNTVLWNSATLFSADGSSPIATIAQGQDITERKRIETSLKQRVLEFETINRLSLAMRAGRTLDELLQILSNEMVEILNAEEGAILLEKTNEDVLQVSGGTGWFMHWINEVFPLRESFAYSVLSSNKVYQSRSAPFGDRMDVLSMLFPGNANGVMFPIRGAGEAIGLLVLIFPAAHVVSEDDQRLLSIISQLGANAISRSLLHDQVESANENLKKEIAQKEITEKLLAAEKELLATTLMSLGEGVVITGQDGNILLMNKAAESMIAIRPSEAIGWPLEKVLHLIDSGTQLPIPSSLDALRKMDRRQHSDHGYKPPVLVANDGSRVLVAGNLTPLQARDGYPTGNVVVFQDITEKSRMESQIRLSQKLEAIGQLAAGIAHEINTPIQYVGDNLKYVQKTFDRLAGVLEVCRNQQDASPSKDPVDILKLIKENRLEKLLDESPVAIQEAMEGVERVRKIVLAMREFSHPDAKEKKLADINHGIETTALISRNEWKYCAHLVLALAPNLPLVNCVMDEINQVILNMIVNAAQSIQETIPEGSEVKGRIVIETQSLGDRVQIKIQDSGKGIPDELQTRIFDPFFTTKGVGKGTGQGLSLAHNIIVNKHHGQIHLVSQPGHGATFVIEIPIDPGIATIE